MARKPKNVAKKDWQQFESGLAQIGDQVRADGHDYKPMTPAEFASAAPDQLGNDRAIEIQWAAKAFKFAETYMKLIVCARDLSSMRLTSCDDAIYADFRSAFPDLDIATVSDDGLKSSKAKRKWRKFCESFKDRVKDYNMASLMRLDAEQDFNETNSTIVPRAQFYAIEIARNREGANNPFAEREKASKAAAAAAAAADK